jgi:phosphatidylglycerol---prolipoprotein diacylglyceryl transferase
MHPILFEFGPLTLRSYGALMALSFVLGITLALRLNRRAGRPDEPMLDLATVIMLGAVVAAYGWLRWKKLPIWAYGDVVAPGLALGQVTGRLGCWFNGCCYGHEHPVYGVVFPSLGDNVPHLPVMLYEAAFCLLLAGALYAFWGKRRFDGQVFALYGLAYAAWRFGIEFLRGDPERGTLISAALSPSQWLSLGVLAFALFLYALLRRRPLARA